MSFSLGGILKPLVGQVAHAIPGVSQIYDAFGAVASVVKGNSAIGRAISTPIMALPAPRIIAPPPPMRLPAVASPNLPALPAGAAGGVVKINPAQQGADPGAYARGAAAMQAAGVGGHGHITKRGTWTNRRRPRMNPMNVRAARRAVNRIHAAEKLFRRILSVAHPGKPHGHISPKKRK